MFKVSISPEKTQSFSVELVFSEKTIIIFSPDLFEQQSGTNKSHPAANASPDIMTILADHDQPDKPRRDRWLLLLRTVQEYNRQYRTTFNAHNTVLSFFQDQPDS